MDIFPNTQKTAQRNVRQHLALILVHYLAGNLLVIAFVSYFGAKLHRPKVIAVGSFTMALGSFLSAMPHFFMG